MAISRHAYSLIALPDSREFAQAVRHGIHGTLYHLQGTGKPREHRADGTNFTFVPSRCLHGASWVAKLHSVQVNADRRDHDTWLTWLSPRVRLTGSSGAGKPRALRSVPTTRCSLTSYVISSMSPGLIPRVRTTRGTPTSSSVQSHSRTRTERRRSSGSTSTSAIASCSRPSRAAIGSKPPSLSRWRRADAPGDGRPGHGGLGCGHVRGEGSGRALRAQPAGLRA